MNEISKWPKTGSQRQPAKRRRSAWTWIAAVALIAAAVAAWFGFSEREGVPVAVAAIAPAPVTVSKPLRLDVDTQIGFLGQFSAVDRVELRAQVGGTLTEIHFEDGQIVHQGDLLFVIDSQPYEIRLAQATAQLQAATSRLALAKNQLQRAQTLKRSEFGSAESVDQRTFEQGDAQAAIDEAKAAIRDAQFDIEHCRIYAPFTGRIGAHLQSVGSLIAGSRYASSPTTLLATLVSLDPIHLDFDMSEADYLTFSRQRASQSGPLADQVDISLSDENKFTRQGTLEFVDNSLDRSSGTIHARAIVSNPDFFLTPGQFARLRLAVAPPAPALMVPDAAVLLDQTQHIVMTVSPDGTVVPKPVETGDLRGGLRIIRSGLAADDRVIIDGIVRAMPGGKVTPQDGTITYNAASDGQG
ncbi:MAG TPA: efflux RND transporter periplasmic adaptor subunit [Hypericibacter adhaerens]|jgi:RND family efflux transporter MFP subunit|uniref:MexE family multidrug efflux RND transporter periplasmic adaptor subunit n=1 Tax=Hypericibacter adhaerens TaxID=2602016 RepID=A0A5J6N477_9PROT|nr:efflux RND transporter periplasmic adaptor subunit [Hypericibacter adhaerens]QEX24639.1 MexE family multidrug efflux RND transporter periplasmic adaptor subunit [Hypericibacter adhaerens]HWA45850.1 efflux RND transporter periplasmic adaptor subunit [Hypericibacter adhaerens]